MRLRRRLTQSVGFVLRSGLNPQLVEESVRGFDFVPPARLECTNTAGGNPAHERNPRRGIRKQRAISTEESPLAKASRDSVFYGEILR
jgi:hypothetical protein